MVTQAEGGQDKAEASVDVHATERKTRSRDGCETDKKDTRDGGDGARYMSIVNQHEEV